MSNCTCKLYINAAMVINVDEYTCIHQCALVAVPSTSFQNYNEQRNTNRVKYLIAYLHV